MDAAYEKARQIVDKEWTAFGWSKADREAEDDLVELFEDLVAGGRLPEEILAEWSTLTAEQILSQYRTTQTTLARSA